MSDYINFEALGRVLLYSLVAGVVVVAAFSTGARVLARAEGARAVDRPAPLYYAAAAICFLVAAVGVGLGIWFVLDK